jgi:O-succinylbenzoic acid--CoA ligase
MSLFPGGISWLEARARATAEALALVSGSRRWSYAALQREVEVVAHNLVARGVQPGDRVAALLSSGPTYVFLLHAVARLGATLVPLNTRLAQPELARQLRHVACAWLGHDARWADMAHAIAAPGVDLLAMEALSRVPRHPTLPAVHLSGEAPQAIVFTSGTSGTPKGAILTFANIFWSATASAFRLGVLPGDRWLSCLPLYHVGGLAILWRSCLYGTAVVLHDGFDATAVSESLDADAITLTSLVPTMLYRLLPLRAGWPAALRLVLLGGAAADADLLAAALGAGVPVATTYGLTEAASQVATLLPAGVSAKPGSVGRPLLYTDVQIHDEAGQPQAPGVYGEVTVAGPTVMPGYWNNPAATADALVDGRLRTGDVGYLDDDGDLWLVQRRGDIIVSGGENVYPAEVEATLRAHAAVAAACVAGVPHPEWGQEVAAMVVLVPGATVTAAQLREDLRAHLAGYKLPRRIQFVAALPQTASGKVARATVAARLAGD